MPFVETPGGVNIHYEETGSGPPLVFVHGWAMYGRVWRFQAEGLSPAFRVITVDLRGHGSSSSPALGYGFDDFAADLALLFDRLALERATLIGWSMGAQVALQAFPLLRHRLASLVLVAGTARFTASEDYPYGLPATEARGMGLRLKRDYTRTMGEFFRGMFAPGELTRERENRIAREIVMAGKPPQPEAALESLAALAAADQRPLLPDIDLPVLLVHGSRDAVCLPDASRHMAERLPNATLRIMEGAGHAPFLSRPEEFNGIVREFFRDVYGRD